MNIHIMPDDTFVDEFITLSSKIPNVKSEYWVDIPQNKTKTVKGHSAIVDLTIPNEEVRKTLLRSDKIFIHSLSKNCLNYFSDPSFKNKIYWLVWGYDLYAWLDVKIVNNFDAKRGNGFSFPLNNVYFLYQSLRRKWQFYSKPKAKFLQFLSNLKGIMHYNSFDIDLLNSQYKVSIPHIHFFYKNLLDWPQLDAALSKSKEGSDHRKVLLGNSSTETNNHFSIFEIFSCPQFDDFRMYVPLSYGNMKYREAVESYGHSKLGDRFIPVVDYMSATEYTEFLNLMDIGIMNHIRSQAMGNIIGLLYLGKRVFLNTECTTYGFLKSNNFLVFSIEELKTKLINDDFSEVEKEHNRKKIKDYFSDKNFLNNLRQVYVD